MSLLLTEGGGGGVGGPERRGTGAGWRGVLMGAEAQFDNGSGVGHQFGLPAVIGLEFLHGGFGLRVPMATGLTREITRLDEGRLNLSGAAVVDCALSDMLGGWLGVLAGRGRTAAGVG